MDAVLRLMRDEPPKTLSRQLWVKAYQLAAWRHDFLEGGTDALRGQQLADPQRISHENHAAAQLHHLAGRSRCSAVLASDDQFRHAN